MFIIYIFIFFISGLMVFLMNYKYLLINLLSIEYMMLMLIFFIYFLFNKFMIDFFFIMMFLTFMVTEGVTGISLFINMIRNLGNNNLANICLLNY